MCRIVMTMVILAMVPGVSAQAGYKELRRQIIDYRLPVVPMPGPSVDETQSHGISSSTVQETAGAMTAVRGLALAWDVPHQDVMDLLATAGADKDVVAFARSIAGDVAAIGKQLGKQVMLPELEVLCLLRNPSVKAADHRFRAARDSFTQVMDLDTTVSQYAAFTAGLSNPAGPAGKKESIRSSYPFPGTLTLQGRMVNEAVGASQEERQRIARDLLVRLGNRFRDLVYVREAIEINNDVLDAFLRLGDVAGQLYSSGKTGFSDIIRINIRTSILKEKSVTLAGQEKTLSAEILGLLDLPLDLHLGVPESDYLLTPVASPEALFSSALEQRQELRQLRHTIDRMAYLVEMGETMVTRPYTLGLSAYDNDTIVSTGTGASKTAFQEKTMAGMKNNVPQGNWFGVNNAWLSQTRQTLDALKQTLKDRELETRTSIRKAWLQVDTARREIALFTSDVVPMSQSDLDASTRGYESGSLRFDETVTAYTNVLDNKLLLAEKKRAFGNGLAELWRLCGKRL